MSGSGPASSSIDRIAAGSSTSASGLPAASRRTRSRVLAERSGAYCRSSASEAARSSGATSSSSSPAPTIASPRTANSATIGSAPSRRATNVSTSTVGTSSNWASSATSTSGPSEAASVMSSRAASAMRKGSAIPASSSPNAASRLLRWTRPSSSSLGRSGESNWCRPANGRCASHCTPRVESTVIARSRARSTTAPSSVDLPMPASPRTMLALPMPFAARSNMSNRNASSTSRP